MTDPTPLLSTVAASSAAMVAIVGGLLVARFVTITSEQAGVQQLLDDADGRLTTARERKRNAAQALYSWDVNSFFEAKVVRAISDGERDVAALREIGDPTRLSNDSLAHVINEIATEFDKARQTLHLMIDAYPSADSYPDWPDFNRAATLPETTWPDVWEITYDNMIAPVDQAPPSNFPMVPFIMRPPEYVALDVQRRDALRDDLQRAQQQVEDIGTERAHLERRRAAIVRPKGLGWGLVVLGFFTVVGILIPLWLMSRGPTRLTAHLGEVVFWLFFTGLVILLSYMAGLALRLSNWRWRWWWWRNTPRTTPDQGDDPGLQRKVDEDS
jgi:hypothetical protein